MATRRLKRLYMRTILGIILVLAVIRLVSDIVTRSTAADDAPAAGTDTVAPVAPVAPVAAKVPPAQHRYRADGERGHQVHGIANMKEVFNDSNHVQLLAAQQWGVTPVKDREEAEQRKAELVYVGRSPYYDVAKLDASIPYLVPRAAILLEDIGRAFYDSLQAKDMPMHMLTVSSATRTVADVARLQRSNKNATTQSCHLYGTTFDINYNKYPPLTSRHATEQRLKLVLSEVLGELRDQGRCYIKYELKEPCFHITVR